MSENHCSSCNKELEGDGEYHCSSCDSHFKKIGYCPKCDAELEKLQACGAAGYFCNSCNELKSRSKIQFKFNKLD
ncbi:zinc ribbon domain-containing protein [Vibrio sp. RC27]